jgi:hypothetical protein
VGNPDDSLEQGNPVGNLIDSSLLGDQAARTVACQVKSIRWVVGRWNSHYNIHLVVGFGDKELELELEYGLGGDKDRRLDELAPGRLVVGPVCLPCWTL